MLPDDEVSRPHQTRREHQQALARRHRRRRRQRSRRVARIRMWRAVQSLQFWAKTLVIFVFLACIAFWAKFAVVYNIPAYAERGLLYGISAYVSEKSWWFGPLAFNIGSYSASADPVTITVDPVTGLVGSLGQYQTILVDPHFVWVRRAGG